MIVRWLLDLVWSVLLPPLELIPAFEVPDVSAYLAQMGPIFQWLGWANYYVPLNVILALGLAYVTLYLGSTLVRLVIWVLTKAHILGGAK